MAVLAVCCADLYADLSLLPAAVVAGWWWTGCFLPHVEQAWSKMHILL